jgi:hypothetical protein
VAGIYSVRLANTWYAAVGTYSFPCTSAGRWVVRHADFIAGAGNLEAFLFIDPAKGYLYHAAVPAEQTASWDGRQVVYPGEVLKIQIIQPSGTVLVSGYDLS